MRAAVAYVLLVVLASCCPSPAVSLDGLSAAELETIRKEAEVLARQASEQIEKSNSDGVSIDVAGLPPALSRLKPQLVHVERLGNGLWLVELQLLGGFCHQGLLIVVGPAPASYVPVAPSAAWKVRKLADRLFKYAE